MTKNNFVKSIVALSLLTSAAVAASGAQFSVGLEGQYDYFKAQGNGNADGGSAGINAGFVFNTPSNVAFGIDGRLLFGKVEGIKTTHYELHSFLGYNIAANACTTLTPYVGFGFYSKEFKKSGVNIRVEAPYIPFGVAVKSTINKDWDMTVRGEYDLVLPTKLKIKAPLGSTSFTTSTADVHGFKANVDFTKNKTMSFGPYVNVWNVSKINSNIVEAGVKVAFHF